MAGKGAAPVVRLGLLRIASRRDAASTAVASYPDGVKVVVDALTEVELLPEDTPKNRDRFGADVKNAYARWQVACQVPVTPGSEGEPDEVTLRLLARRTGFRVVD